VTPSDVEELAAHWTAAQHTVAAFIRAMVTDFHQSEEVLQRVAVTLVRKYDQYDRGRPFVAWALGMAKFEALAFLREGRTDRLVFDDTLLDRIAEGHERVSQEHVPFPQFVTECVDQLDGRSRRAIQLRYDGNLRTAQIARAMQISDGAARMLLSRARNLLRQCLEMRVNRWKEVR
jgi:RNA polymerase sigma-70 factor, ECF subfamily